MSEPWHSLKWLLDTDFRVRNVVSLLAGLIAVAIAAGPVGVSSEFWLGLVLGISLLSAWLITTIAQWIDKRRKEKKALKTQEANKLLEKYRVVESLTDEQLFILYRFIDAERRQLPGRIFGSYRVLWSSDMDVLMKKRVVHSPTRDIYEISGEYYQFIRELRETAESRGESANE